MTYPQFAVNGTVPQIAQAFPKGAALAFGEAFADDGAIATAADDAALPPGTKVEVRSRFDGRWARGFVIEARVDDGYRVRRASDNSTLPAAFAPDDVRVERKRQGMWWA